MRVRAVRLLVVAGSIAILTSCTYQLAMRKADNLASRGEWEEAYTAYAKAAEKRPDDATAVTGRNNARDKVVAGAVEAAEAALARDDYEGCVAELTRAESFDPDAPEVYRVKAKADAAIRQALITAWESGDARAAYGLAVRARKLFPKAEYLEATFGQLRGHYTTRAVELLKTKKFDVSLAAVRTIVEFEPEQKSAMAPLETKILEAWADDLVAKATVHVRAKRLGAAAALYAHAYELAGRKADLDQAHAVAKTLAPTAAAAVKIDVTGVPVRSAAMKAAVATGLAGIPDTTSTSAAPALAVKVSTPAPRCSETDNITKAEQDYISGQVEKPNPDYGSISKQLTAARAEEAAAKSASEKLWPQLQAAETQVTKYDTALKDAEKKQAEAETAYDAAATQLDAAKKKKDEVEAEVDRLHTSGAAEATIHAAEVQLGELGLRASEWSGEVISREEAEGRARRELAQVIALRGPAVETRDRLKTEYEGLVQQRTSAQSVAGDLTARLGSTPKTVMEDVHATLKYDVHDWTRTCTAPVSIAMTTKWTTTLPKAKSLSPAERVADRSHIGHVKAGLAEDKKLYPKTDAELVATADATTAAAVVTWITALVEDQFRDRVGRARAAVGTAPNDAATAIVALYVGAPSRIDADSLAVFQAGLRDAYGLEKMELLRPTP